MKGKYNRGVAQLASASGLGPEGPVFESQYPDFKATIIDSCFFLYIFGPATKRDYDKGKWNREGIWQSEGFERY